MAIVLDVDKPTCMKLDKFRETNPNREHLSRKVGSIPIHTFYKSFEMPTTGEGFDEVYTANLVLKFSNDEDESFYNLIH